MSGLVGDKRKLATMSVLQLLSGVTENREEAFQILVTPTIGDFPKRTVTLSAEEIPVFCAEVEAVVALLRAKSRASA